MHGNVPAPHGEKCEGAIVFRHNRKSREPSGVSSFTQSLPSVRKNRPRREVTLSGDRRDGNLRVHRGTLRPGYRLAVCSPAEHASFSPGNYHGTPIRVLTQLRSRAGEHPAGRLSLAQSDTAIEVPESWLEKPRGSGQSPAKVGGVLPTHVRAFQGLTVLRRDWCRFVASASTPRMRAVAYSHRLRAGWKVCIQSCVSWKG